MSWTKNGKEEKKVRVSGYTAVRYVKKKTGKTVTVKASKTGIKYKSKKRGGKVRVPKF